MESPVAIIVTALVLLIGGVHMIVPFDGGGNVWRYIGIVAVVVAVMNGLVAMGRLSNNANGGGSGR